MAAVWRPVKAPDKNVFGFDGWFQPNSSDSLSLQIHSPFARESVSDVYNYSVTWTIIPVSSEWRHNVFNTNYVIIYSWL